MVHIFIDYRVRTRFIQQLVTPLIYKTEIKLMFINFLFTLQMRDRFVQCLNQSMQTECLLQNINAVLLHDAYDILRIIPEHRSNLILLHTYFLTEKDLLESQQFLLFIIDVLIYIPKSRIKKTCLCILTQFVQTYA
ncbi:hypothetical protein D3C76_1181340 [compost metagenome]